MARTLQRDLDRIAQQADTTTEEGLHHVLTGMGVHSISNVYRGVDFFYFNFFGSSISSQFVLQELPASCLAHIKVIIRFDNACALTLKHGML
jgi:hypothetical protein